MNDSPLLLQPVFLILPEPAVAGELFARQCMLQVFARGESPLALRSVFATVLDVTDERERQMADRAADAWMNRAARVICFCDFGFTALMKDDLRIAVRNALPLEYRRYDRAGHPSVESLHFHEVPHPRKDCAICSGPDRVAGFKREQQAQRDSEAKQTTDVTSVKKGVATFDEAVTDEALARSRAASEAEHKRRNGE